MSTKIPVGLQLFAVRGEVEKDLPGTLAEAARMGYAGVEPWGYNGEKVEWQGRSAAEMRRMLDDNGLACCGIHLSTGALQGDNLKRTVELNKTLGNRFLIVAADSQRMKSAAGIAELRGILEAAADAVRPEGMFTGYHAHGFDFAKVDDGGTERTAWDVLFSSARPDIVMQLDTGNCTQGGADPVAVLTAHPNRARTVHLRDYGGAGPQIAIGEGDADWPEILRLCEETQGTEWYVVEQGGQGGNGFDIPRRCREALRAMGR